MGTQAWCLIYNECNQVVAIRKPIQGKASCLAASFRMQWWPEPLPEHSTNDMLNLLHVCWHSKPHSVPHMNALLDRVGSSNMQALTGLCSWCSGSSCLWRAHNCSKQWLSEEQWQCCSTQQTCCKLRRSSLLLNGHLKGCPGSYKGFFITYSTYRLLYMYARQSARLPTLWSVLNTICIAWVQRRGKW